MLSAYVSKKQTNWEHYLPIMEFAAKHMTTGFSKFMLMYGCQPRSPMTVGWTTEKVQQAKEFLQEHFDMLRIAP